MVSTRKVIRKVKGRQWPNSTITTKGFADPSKQPHYQTSSERLARLVAAKARYGGRIVLHQLSTVPLNPAEQQKYDEVMRAIRQKRILMEKRGYSAKLEQLRTKARVLSLSNRLQAISGGRKPAVHHILAAVGLEYGLDSPQLKKIIRKIGSMDAWRPQDRTWEGNSAQLYKAIMTRTKKGPLLSSIDTMLGKEKKAFTSTKILELLDMPMDRKNQSKLNAGLQLLEIMGLVRKMPMLSKRGGGISVWASAEYANPPIDYPNAGMSVLAAAYASRESGNAGVLKTDVYKLKTNRGVTTGSEKGEFTETTITMNIKLLIDGGLITTVDTWIPGSKGLPQLIKLTPYGLRLMEEYYHAHSTPEALRKLLLGEREDARKKFAKYREIASLLNQLLLKKS